MRVPPLPAPRIEAPHASEIVRVEIRDPNVLPLLGDNGEMRKLEEIEAQALRKLRDPEVSARLRECLVI